MHFLLWKMQTTERNPPLPPHQQSPPTYQLKIWIYVGHIYPNSPPPVPPPHPPPTSLNLILGGLSFTKNCLNKKNHFSTIRPSVPWGGPQIKKYVFLIIWFHGAYFMINWPIIKKSQPSGSPPSLPYSKICTHIIVWLVKCFLKWYEWHNPVVPMTTEEIDSRKGLDPGQVLTRGDWYYPPT